LTYSQGWLKLLLVNRNKEKIQKLLSYMIEVSTSDDVAKRDKDPAFKGEGWMTFHLKTLEELINDAIR